MTDETVATEDPNLFSTRILTKYVDEHTTEVCAHLARAQYVDAALIAARLPDSTCAKLLAQLPDTVSDRIIAAAEDTQLSDWLAAGDPDDAIAIAFRTSTQRRNNLIALPGQNRLVIERLQSLQLSNLGPVLRVDFLRVNTASTREDIVQELKRHGNTSHRAIFVCENNGRYTGTIEWHRALTAEPQEQASQLSRRVQPILVSASIEQASKVVQWRTHRELPIVDEKYRLIGSVYWSDLQQYRAKKPNAREKQSTNLLSPLGSLDITTAILKRFIDFLVGHRGRT